jgi:hypothetical protein
MKNSKHFLLSIIILSAILLGACNLPSGQNDGDADPTSVASTIIASTANAVFTHAAETAAAVNGIPSATTAPEATALPTNTLIPTIPPITATNTPIPCNRASFVKDVNYPDNTEVAAGASFTKTWQIQNNGSCTWTSGYVLLFDSGDQMGAPATATITAGTVAPGATVNISVDLTAPATPGTYQGKFKLRSPDNIVFGINADAQGPFWLKIVVPVPPTLPPPPPPIHSSGPLAIASSFPGNLDDGADDIWYHKVAANDDYIEPKVGATIVKWGGSQPSIDQCTGAALAGNAITLDNALVNQYICYETDQGRFGYFKVTAYDGSTLNIDYLTWD